ncbi:imidazole glycerol phosphate synthase subunit HisH [Lysobacter sp. D1-1-M9]|uniref:imidazole glycerol phosphate synthase subunit HisH n=1 Tax=Novilysobacter longmucuonensis TaxID=3098603 RepID=UPI002FCB1686
MKVVLIDSGGANIGSVLYALERLDIQAQLSGDAATIAGADRVILPGVGAAAAAMARLHALGLVKLIRELQQPLLGICLGMQLLFDSSEEGDVECLGLIPGRVRKLLPVEPSLIGCANSSATTPAEQARLYPRGGVRVPHMGWNRLQIRREDPLLTGIDDGAQAYFVHSYAAPVTADTLAACSHGDLFSAVVRRRHCHGAQFHPERSGVAGARLLENFLREVPA